MGLDNNIDKLAKLSRRDLEQIPKEQLLDLVLVLIEQNRELSEQNRKLTAQNQMLIERNSQLQERVENLERRLHMNSTNSSLPPSSDPPSTNKKPPRKNKKRKRKRGGQKGHKGSCRQMLPEDQVDHFVDLTPCSCERCGGLKLKTDPNDPWRHQVVELQEILTQITEYRMHNGICKKCGHHTRASLPNEVSTRNFGPKLESFVAYLSGSGHLSKRRIQELLQDVFKTSMSLGAISGCEATVSESLKVAYIEAHQAAEKVDIAHADESGWREGLSTAWLWVMVTNYLVVFMVDKRRSQEAAKRLLNKFDGILVCDRYGAYNIHKGLRQFCWAHLLRHFYGFSELPGEAGRIGEKLVSKTHTMFHWLHRVRDGTMERKDFKDRMQKLKVEIEDLLILGKQCGQKNISGTCKQIMKKSHYLWIFVEHEQVPPTNNEAERAIRKVVLWRKGSFGTQSERGSRFVERILTTISTCRKQGRSVFEFLTDSRLAHINRTPFPTLLPST
jgi:transposase